MPATAYLLPVGSVVSDATVSTRTNNYTLDDGGLQQLLHDSGLDIIAELFPTVGKLRYDGTPVTNVAVTCVIGVSTPTPLGLHYDIPSFTPGSAAPPPVVLMGDGDGTVNRWASVASSRDVFLLTRAFAGRALKCAHNGPAPRCNVLTRLST